MRHRVVQGPLVTMLAAVLLLGACAAPVPVPSVAPSRTAPSVPSPSPTPAATRATIGPPTFSVDCSWSLRDDRRCVGAIAAAVAALPPGRPALVAVHDVSPCGGSMACLYVSSWLLLTFATPPQAIVKMTFSAATGTFTITGKPTPVSSTSPTPAFPSTAPPQRGMFAVDCGPVAGDDTACTQAVAAAAVELTEQDQPLTAVRLMTPPPSPCPSGSACPLPTVSVVVALLTGGTELDVPLIKGPGGTFVPWPPRRDFGAPAGSPLGVTLTPTPHPSGITEQEAVTDARQYSSLPTFVSVTSGPYSEVAASRLPPETSPDPNRLVWAVTFTGSAVVCPPPAGPSMASCLPPVPATTVVYLDYETGSFILSTGAPQ